MRGTVVLLRARRRIVLPFLSPGLALLAVFFLYPLVRTGYISLTEWSRVGTSRYVGLQQYSRLVGDPDFFTTMKNSVMFALVGGCMLFPPAIAMAWAFHQRIPGERFFRFVVFAPVALSVAVVALMWKFLLHPTMGLVDPGLRSIGLASLARTWLGDPSTALPAVAFVLVWHAIGTWVVLLSAGFERLPADVLEAARVDGASEWNVFWRIQLPLLSDVLRVLLVLWLVQSIQAFAYVFIMTGGGPFGSTDLVVTRMYRLAFDQGDFGYAAAMGIVLVLALLGVALLLNRVLRRDRLQY